MANDHYKDFVLAWQQNKIFRVENDKIKSKAYFFSSFPNTEFYGFQDGNVRSLLIGDFFSRYYRMNEYNVLFPTGLSTLGKTVHENIRKYKNDELVKIYQQQLERLGVGIDSKHFLLLNQKEYVSDAQLAFLQLYQRGYIKYDYMKVYYDKAHKQISDVQLPENQGNVTALKVFYLDISEIQNDLVIKIDNLPVAQPIKKKLLGMLCPKESMVMDFMVTNGTRIKLQFKEPEYMGGISFILIHPDYVDFTMYSTLQEFSSIEKYLADDNTNDFGVFTGSYAINPLTGKRIPIYISVLHACPIYVANPFLNEEDRQIALDEMLPVVDVVQNGVFIESDFLNGVEEQAGRKIIMERFLEADMCEIEKYYSRDKILLSSLDMFGILYPFLVDEDGKLYSLEQNLPITLSSKLNMIISDIPVNKINGSINMTFAKGMLPILSLLYDEIGGSISIFSKEAINSLRDWGGIEVLSINENELLEYVLFPLCIEAIIEKEKKVTLQPLFKKLVVNPLVVDANLIPINRIHNNLLDFNSLFNQLEEDTIRSYFLKKSPDEPIVFDKEELNDLNHLIGKILAYFENNFCKQNQLDSQFVDFQTHANGFLDQKDVTNYVHFVLGFFENTVANEQITSKQGLVYLKMLYPVMPFLAETIYAQKYKGKYLICNLGWPI